MATASNLSFSEIQKRIKEMDAERKELEAQLEAKRGEELKVLADAYAKKLQAGGFAIYEGIKALAPYAEPAKKQRAKKGEGAQRPASPFEKGVTYKDPSGQGKNYVGGALGAKPKWLQELQAAGSDVSAFAVK